MCSTFLADFWWESKLIKKKWIVFGAMLAGSSGVANAALIATFSEGMHTQHSTATVFDFDSGKPSQYSGQGSVLSYSVPGMSAQPGGDSTPYLSVAYPDERGIETFTAAPGTSYNYFGLYWGSIDIYNNIRFYSGNEVVADVSGYNLLILRDSPLGIQAAPQSNHYVNILFTDKTFDRVEFKTVGYAFESDNHAYANVPEPGTLALMSAAFAGFALRRRRTRNEIELRT
jgi:hypothetical protein